MIVREVEAVDRISIGGRSRDIRVEEGRGVGPGRPDGGTVSVDGVAGDAAGGRRPREGDPCGCHAGGVETGGGGGRHGRRGGIGMEDGAPREPVGGGAKRGRPLLGARSEERRVGKECRARGWAYQSKKNEEGTAGRDRRVAEK